MFGLKSIFGKTNSKPQTILFDNQVEQLASTNSILVNADKPISALPKNHPFKDNANHTLLLNHCKNRIMLGKDLTNSLRERFRIIDQDLNGFVNLSTADRKRSRDNARGLPRKPTDMVLPIADAKIDELLTFLMQVFWPNEGMHNAYSSYQKQNLANSFALLMNKHGQFFQHYSKITEFFYEALKYNFSVLWLGWKQTKGMKLETDPVGGVDYKDDSVLFEGNNIENVDPYNFFFDPSISPVNIGIDGEFAGEVKMFSSWGILKLAAAGEITNMVAAIKRGKGEQVFYNDHPIVRFDYSSAAQGVVTDWQSWASNRGGAKMNGNEIVFMYCRIVPKDFGLSPSEKIEIWRFGIMNGHTIVYAQNEERAHKRIPYVCAIPKPDNLFMQKKSAAEDLIPLQNFASFLLNLHLNASRKSLFGITVYDPNFIDLSQSEGDVAAKLPTKRSLPPNGKIDDYIKEFRDSPETAMLVDQTEKIFAMLETILPTNILKQVTDLDRATTYQAAATVQGTNRRSLKMAKNIDDQAVTPLKYMMMYNIQELQPEVTIINPANGSEVKISPAALRGQDLSSEIGEGLQSIDKLMIINLLHDVINAILQSAQASQEIDIVSLLNYWTTLIGDRTDLNQFRRAAPTLDQVMKLAQTSGIIADAQSTQAQSFQGNLQQMYGGNNPQVVKAAASAPMKLNGATPPAPTMPGAQ